MVLLHFFLFFFKVQEEVITDDWVNPSGEERIELPVNELGSEQQIAYENDNDIPLPTDQDEYTASRPYPCDFCSRRFRKKANLMNHMVAHQTDRPHGCNLCGARYIRKCDLLNHLKIHAYQPEADDLEDELLAPLSEELEAKAKETKPGKAKKKKKSPRIKQVYFLKIIFKLWLKIFFCRNLNLRHLQDLIITLKKMFVF